MKSWLRSEKTNYLGLCRKNLIIRFQMHEVFFFAFCF
jgi:hypothetical protein